MKTSFAIAFAAALILMSGAASAESASANAASSPCADGKCSYIDFTSGKDFNTQDLYGPNSQVAGAGASGISEVVISGSTFSSSAPGYFIFNGTQKITIENSTFSNATDTALFFQSHKHETQTVNADAFGNAVVGFNNVNLTNNSSSSGSGAAMYVYGKLDMTMKDGAVSGNTITYPKAGQAYGGAIVVKSGNVVFENVDFDNNVVKAESGYATGGAILVDKTTGIKENGKDLVGDVTFKITKNGLTYAGNNVVGKADSYVDTYGWYASTSGGFLFLDRSSRGTFDIADGVTLTIGEAGADYINNPELDSIASAVPKDSNRLDYAKLTKKGEGTVQMNASMDKYFSFFNVEEGTFNIAQEWHNRAKTTVTGGTLNAAGGLVLDNLKQEKNSYYQNGTITVDGGALVAPSIAFKNTANATDKANKSTLTIASGTVTTKDLNTTNGVLTLSGGALNVTGNLTVAANTFELAGGELATSYKNFFAASQAGGTLAGTDNLTNIKGTDAAGIIVFTDDIDTYTLDQLHKTQAQFNADGSNAVKVVFRNGTLNLEKGDDLTSSSLDNLVVENAVGDAKADGDFTVTNDTTIAAVDFGSSTTAKAGSSSGMLTLTANAAGGNVFVYDADSKLDTVEVKNVQLGNNESASGNVNIKKLNVKEKLDVVGAFTAQDVALDSFAKATVSGAFDLKSLTGEGSLSVEEGGILSATNIGANVQLGDGGMLVLNSASVDDAGVTGVVSTQAQAPMMMRNAMLFMSVEPEKINANIVATNRNAKAIIASLNHIEDVDGFNERSILFVDRAVKLGSDGRINIGSIEGAAGTLAIGENALAILDADSLSGGAPVVEGKLSVAEGSEVYVIANGKKSLLLTEEETPLAAVPNVTVSNKLLGMTAEVQKDRGLVATIGVKENATKDAELLSAINTAFNNAKNGRVLGAIAEVEGFYTDDFTEAGRHAAEEYLAMPVTAGTYNVAYDAAEQVTGAVLRRNLDPSTGLGVWADVFYTTNEAKKIYGGQGYSADIYGAALGFDGTFACGAKLGLALSVGSGDADAEKSIGKYSNDADFWGISVYTGKAIDGLYLSADASYLSLDNDVKGSIAGASADESLDSSVFTVGVRGDLTVYDQAFKVVPHVGLRYTKIDVDDYRGISADSMNVFETPVGVRVAGEFAPAAGWTVTPDIDFTIVPQVGDKEVSTLVGDVDVLDNVYNTTLAVRAAFGNFSFGLSYRYGFGADDRSNNAFEARAAYVW